LLLVRFFIAKRDISDEMFVILEIKDGQLFVAKSGSGEALGVCSSVEHAKSKIQNIGINNRIYVVSSMYVVTEYGVNG
jgi:predicted transcriptional regulator